MTSDKLLDDEAFYAAYSGYDFEAMAADRAARIAQAQADAERIAALEAQLARQWGCEGRHQNRACSPDGSDRPHHHHDERCLPGVRAENKRLKEHAVNDLAKQASRLEAERDDWRDECQRLRRLLQDGIELVRGDAPLALSRWTRRAEKAVRDD